MNEHDLTEDEIIERHKLNEDIDERMRPIPEEPAVAPPARAALDRRVVELLERLLRGEHGIPCNCGTDKQIDRVQAFEDGCRALLAELKKETPHA